MYIKRSLEGIVRKYLAGPEYLSVIGARQAGKTTLLRHIYETVENAAFLTFEDIQIRALFDKDIKSFIKLYVDPHRYLFIDEFQYAKKGGQALKFIFDTVPGKKIIISGSSSLDLTVAAVKHLAGRLLSFNLYPLSFAEFLNFRNPALFQIRAESQGRLEEPVVDILRPILDEFIVYGGYPRVVLAGDDDEKRTILKNIFNIYLLRDVRDILGLIDDYQLLALIKALALQTGNVVSYQELGTIIQQKQLPLRKHLRFLEKTFILNFIKPFFSNKRTELIKNPKIYFVDSGLRNSVIGDFRPLEQRQDKGALLENFHFSEFLKSGMDVKYWRTKAKAEVDFVIDDRIPVEIKSAMAKPVIGKSLHNYLEKYRPEEGFIFNDRLNESRKSGATKVRFLRHFDDIDRAKNLDKEIDAMVEEIYEAREKSKARKITPKI